MTVGSTPQPSPRSAGHGPWLGGTHDEDVRNRVCWWLTDCGILSLSLAYLLKRSHAAVDPKGIGRNARNAVRGAFAQLLQRDVRHRVGVAAGAMRAAADGRRARLRLRALSYYPRAICGR